MRLAPWPQSAWLRWSNLSWRGESDGRVRVVDDPDLLVEAVAVASALGPVSAYTWLKLPAPAEPERVLAATSLPCLLRR